METTTAEFIGVTSRVVGVLLVALVVWGSGYFAGSDNSSPGYIVGAIILIGLIAGIIITVVEAMGL